jgi:uncharacterized membrane protein YccC
MGERSGEKLRRLHGELYNQLSHYRFNRRHRMDERYRRGRIAALEWLCRLSGHYLEEERRLPERLAAEVERQMRRIATLNPSPYRQGIEDAVRDFHQRFGKSPERG